MHLAGVDKSRVPVQDICTMLPSLARAERNGLQTGSHPSTETGHIPASIVNLLLRISSCMFRLFTGSQLHLSVPPLPPAAARLFFGVCTATSLLRAMHSGGPQRQQVRRGGHETA